MQHHPAPGPVQLLHGPGPGAVHPQNPGRFPDHDRISRHGAGRRRPNPIQLDRNPLPQQTKGHRPARLQQPHRKHDPPTQQHPPEHPNKRELHRLRRADVAEHRANQHRDLPLRLARPQRHQVHLADSLRQRVGAHKQQPRHQQCPSQQQ